METFVSFINTADKKLGKEIISPKALFYVPSNPIPMRGLEGYLHIIGMMRSGFPDIQWTLEDMIIENEKVAARFTMRGTHQGTFLGVPATGKSIEARAINIYYLSENQIIEEYGQPDLLGLMYQIGAIPSR
ncbi:ester cyclase [Pedobacter sp. L105]|uniref:ester cyclase n=1 Tax=Pedobacter sp. L105 TaxID=1641871 RepID=UPI001C20AF9F|nr:ester cyclase [Pedobacter sp. L105]